MTADLTLALSRVEHALVTLGRTPLLTLLRKGVDPGETRTLLSGVGLRSTADLEAVYAWRDGTDAAEARSLDDIHIFPGFYLLSAGDASLNYRQFADDGRWRRGWLPVFANGGGDFYVLDLSHDGAEPMRHFRIDESEHPIEFDSLSQMVFTLAEAFDRQVFFVDPDGYLEMDDAKFASLAASMNPDVAWWHE